MNDEFKLQQIVSVFVGNVEWMLCHEAPFERGMDFVARVSGELRGVRVTRSQEGQVYYRIPRIPNREGYSYYTVEPLAREDLLHNVVWEEVRTKRSLFTESERAEWDEIGRRAKAAEQQRQQERESEERRREQAELKRLKEKYGRRDA